MAATFNETVVAEWVGWSTEVLRRKSGYGPDHNYTVEHVAALKAESNAMQAAGYRDRIEESKLSRAMRQYIEKPQLELTRAHSQYDDDDL